VVLQCTPSGLPQMDAQHADHIAASGCCGSPHQGLQDTQIAQAMQQMQ
jgi:hypothetical protein